MRSHTDDTSTLSPDFFQKNCTHTCSHAFSLTLVLTLCASCPLSHPLSYAHLDTHSLARTHALSHTQALKLDSTYKTFYIYSLRLSCKTILFFSLPPLLTLHSCPPRIGLSLATPSPLSLSLRAPLPPFLSRILQQGGRSSTKSTSKQRIFSILSPLKWLNGRYAYRHAYRCMQVKT